MKSIGLRTAVLAPLLLLLTGCFGAAKINSNTPAACVPSSTPEFAYMLTGYTVSMYTIDSCTGLFTPTTPAAAATIYSSPQLGAEELVADPLGRYVYVANLISSTSDLATISSFKINSTTGVLTPTQAPFNVPTGFFPQEIAIDPQGRFVYTANTDDGTISMFTVSPTTGILTPATPASVSANVLNQAVASPNFLTVDSSGKFLFLTELFSSQGAIVMYTINQTTGALTPNSPATVVAGANPFQVVVSPNGKFAYAVNNAGGANGVYQYTLKTSGILAANSPSSVATGNGPTGIAVDPTSHFAYVANRSDNTVSMYTINQSTGNLTLNTTSTYPAGTEYPGPQPFRIAFDVTGKFLYVTNENGPAAIYTVNTDGTLTNAGTTGLSTGALATAFAQ